MCVFDSICGFNVTFEVAFQTYIYHKYLSVSILKLNEIVASGKPESCVRCGMKGDRRNVCSRRVGAWALGGSLIASASIEMSERVKERDIWE